MDDLGAQVSYLVLALDTPVLAVDGETHVGRVAQIRADDDKDIFDGLIVRGGPHGERYVHADRIETVYERGVVLAVDASGFAALPEAPPGRG